MTNNSEIFRKSKKIAIIDWINQLKKSRNRIFILFKVHIAFFVFLSLVSIPIFQAGFFYEGSIGSLIKGLIQINHQTIWSAIFDDIKIYFFNCRIFFLFVISTDLFYYFFHQSDTVQVIRILLIWISLGISAWLIQSILKSKWEAFLLLFIIPFFWTFTNFHYVLTNDILMPLFTISTFFSLYFFKQYFEEKKFLYSLLSSLFYIVSLLLYETAIATPFSLFVMAYFYRSSEKKWLMKLLPTTVITFIYLSTTFWIRHLYPPVYSRIIIGSIHKFPSAFLKQLTATFPFSPYLFSNKLYEYISPVFNLKQIGLSVIFISVLLFIVSFFSNQFLLNRIYVNKKLCLLLVGIALPYVLVPSILSGISARNQYMFDYGIGFFPVYLQYIGVSIILVALLGYWMKIIQEKNHITLKKSIIIMISLIVSVSISINFLLNFSLVKQENEYYKNPRLLMEKALQHHFLRSAISDDSFIISENHEWNTTAFYMQNARIKISNVLRMNDESTMIEISKRLNENDSSLPYLIFLDYYHIPYTTYGCVIEGETEKIHYHFFKNKFLVDYVIVSNPKIFITWKEKKIRSRIISKINQHLAKTYIKSNILNSVKLSNIKNNTVIALSKGDYQFIPWGFYH